MDFIPKQDIITQCHICSSESITNLELDFDCFIRPFGKSFTYKVGYCKNCSFIFNLNPLNAESLNKYYERNFMLRSLDTDDIEQKVFHDTCEMISDHVNLKQENILEIGTSTGKFLTYLRENFNSKTFFDELNLEALSLLSNQNHRSNKDLPKDEKYKLIIMRHVLEHIVEPIDYLSNLRMDIEDDGYVFIEVPDFTFLDNKNDTLLFEHVNYFSHATLTQVLDRSGYIIISHQFSITDNYTTCSDRVLRVLARKKSKKLSEGIPQALERHENFRVKKINDIISNLIKHVGDNGKIGFYGAGWWTERTVQKINIDKKMIVGIFDKDEKKQNTVYHEIPILNPTEIIKLKPDIIFILTSFEPQIKKDLEKIGYDGKIIGWSDLVKQNEE